jgi:hypothetical protein
VPAHVFDVVVPNAIDSVPVVVIGPPMMGHVVAMFVTVPPAAVEESVVPESKRPEPIVTVLTELIPLPMMIPVRVEDAVPPCCTPIIEANASEGASNIARK